MTRKDYNRLAEELKIEYNQLNVHCSSHELGALKLGFGLAINVMMDAMQRENSNFDSDRFTEAVYG